MAGPIVLPPISPTTLDTSLGAIFLGFTLQAVLYGISIVQFYIYLRTDAKENRTTKLLIFFIAIVSTAVMVFMTLGTYKTLVYTLLDPLGAFGPMPWSFSVAYMLGGFLAALISGTYTLRLWRLGGKYALPFTIVQIVLDTTLFAFGLGYGIVGLTVPVQSLDMKYNWLYLVEFSCLTLSNTTITVFLCVTLWSMRTGQRKTDSLISMLMMFSVSTCILVSVVNILAIIAFTASSHTFLYFIADAVQPKIQFNALLAFLNSREFIQKTVGEGPVSIHLPKVRHHPRTSGSGDSVIEITNAKVENMQRFSGSCDHQGIKPMYQG